MVVAAALALAPHPAAAAPDAADPLLTDPAAQRALDTGLEHFYAEHFDLAAAAFAEAYALEPTPFLLYSWAQAERYAEHCGKAIDLFERFLGTAPPDAEAAKARKSIVECGGIPPATLPTPAEPEPVPPPSLVQTPDPEPPPPSATPGPAPAQRPRVGLFVGVSLAAVGSLTAATGGILLAGGRRLRTDAPDSDTQQTYLDALERSERRQVSGVALLGIGAALVVGGILTAVLTSRRR